MRILYAVMGGSDVASSRLRVWSVVPHLKTLGHKCTICANAPSWRFFIKTEPYDLCVFQKTMSWPLDAWDSARGLPRVYDCDDAIGLLSFSRNDMTAITTDTPGHASFFRTQYDGPVHVIPDALDVKVGVEPKRRHNDKLYWVGAVCNVENLYHLSVAAEAIRSLGKRLIVWTNTKHPQFKLHAAFLPTEVIYEAWSLNIDEDLKTLDLFACPYVRKGKNDPWVEGKSANRLMKGWGLGLPVIGTPIPSYEQSGLMLRAETVEEWRNALEYTENPTVRETDAKLGREIAEGCRPARTALMWDVLFRSLKESKDEAA